MEDKTETLVPKVDVEADKTLVPKVEAEMEADDLDEGSTEKADSELAGSADGSAAIDESKTLINLEDLRHAGLDEDDLQILH